MDLREISRLLYQIKLAEQNVASSFERETGFSLTRYEMLQVVKERGVCSQRVIKEEMKIDNAAITRHLKILEEKGYVVRERNAENHREMFVRVTEKAEQDLGHCERDEQTNHLVLKALSAEEIHQLSGLLQKLNSHT
ncbi:MarR family winged helix-turn-helix transcriptional regulator [Exiguobacterium aestuarii]|uniref:MarR family winged helix-turn-helix transcriptional regulator n=1 Tax=Exiguobacterium aestuarii TaxID=273527 RepID=A0ABW2PPI4_9BACL|nr:MULTISPECIES: MarR family transcriptional regulator [Exiguobacterium]MCT4784755.1 MarR family transcriptional regulator [Exiguobacterium aestuarii]